MSTKLVSLEQAKAGLMLLEQLTERPIARGTKRVRVPDFCHVAPSLSFLASVDWGCSGSDPSA
jgi:hypothetical protein